MNQTHRIIDFILSTQTGLRFFQRINRSSTWHLRRMQTSLARKISSNGKIMSGPFKGMLYGGKEDALGSSILPKIVGSYEEELHSCLEEIINQRYDTIIDIGCDDGYYAVGLAMRMTRTQIIAFDINPSALERTASLADANNVKERLTLKRGCDPEQLYNISTKPTCLILSDCEGAEEHLLYPHTLPKSALRCDLLIETHNIPTQPDMAAALIDRFQSSHKSTIFTGTYRQAERYPHLNGLSKGEIDLALNERRPFFMKWIFLQQLNP